MDYYPLLKYAHVTLALVSGMYFAARGLWRLGLHRRIRHPLWRSLPHCIDTLLLATGLALAVIVGLAPLRVEWFAIKLILVVVYILLGMAAFRSATVWRGWLFYTLALLVWFWIVGVALHKHVLSWLA